MSEKLNVESVIISYEKEVEYSTRLRVGDIFG